LILTGVALSACDKAENDKNAVEMEEPSAEPVAVDKEPGLKEYSNAKEARAALLEELERQMRERSEGELLLDDVGPERIDGLPRGIFEPNTVRLRDGSGGLSVVE